MSRTAGNIYFFPKCKRFRGAGASLELSKMTSLAMQWVQQRLGHCFYGKTHGQPGVAQAQKAGRDEQGSLAQQLFAVPPLLEQDTAWHLPCQEQQHLPRYHTGLPKTGVGNLYLK